MGEGPIRTNGAASLPRVLRAYLEGTLPFEEAAALQRKLAYGVSADRDGGAVLVCDHPPGITVGREGSRLHVRLDSAVLAARGWPLHWVGRGGGALLHLPGQVACYPILALDAIGTTVGGYVERLQRVAVEVAASFGVKAEPDPRRPGAVARGRRFAHVGVSVREGVTRFGVVVNVCPDLRPFYDVRCDGDASPMTSLQREAPGRVRVAAVRQRLLEAVAVAFDFGRVSPFHRPAVVVPPTACHAVPIRSR